MSSIFYHWTLDIWDRDASIFWSRTDIIVYIDLLMRLNSVIVTLRRFVLLEKIRCCLQKLDQLRSKILLSLLKWCFCSTHLCWRSNRLFLRNVNQLFLTCHSIFRCKDKTFSWLLSRCRSEGCLLKNYLLFELNLLCRGKALKLSWTPWALIVCHLQDAWKEFKKESTPHFLCMELDIFQMNLR